MSRVSFSLALLTCLGAGQWSLAQVVAPGASRGNPWSTQQPGGIRALQAVPSHGQSRQGIGGLQPGGINNQTVTPQTGGLGGWPRNAWGGQPQSGIPNTGHGSTSGNSAAAAKQAAEFWGAVGNMIEQDWKRNQTWSGGDRQTTWPRQNPTTLGPTLVYPPQSGLTYPPPARSAYPLPANPIPANPTYSAPAPPTYIDEPRVSLPSVPPPNEPPAPRVELTPRANIKPPATKPLVNELKLVGRPLTQAQVQQAKEHFKRRLGELTTTLANALPAVDVDRAELMRVLRERGITAEIQVRLLDALRDGKLEVAQELWGIHCPGVEPPFRRARIRVSFAAFCAKIDAGTCGLQDVRAMEQELIALRLLDRFCCGVPSLLEEIQQCLSVSQAVAGATPGVETQLMALPPGEVDIVFNPRLPDGETIVFAGRTVMLGTGGAGTMHIGRGNIAQQLGYTMGAGVRAVDDNSALVTSGILIENPTSSPVQFVINNQHFSLEPQGRKVFPSESAEIGFDRGTGGEALRYGLTAGTYRFVAENQGWNLQRLTSLKAVIDNSDNNSPFQYIAQGEHVVVAPHATRSHTSVYPLVFRYDRGNGSAVKQVVSNQQQATFTIAVNPEDNLWDMFLAPTKAASPLPAAQNAVTAGDEPVF